MKLTTVIAIALIINIVVSKSLKNKNDLNNSFENIGKHQSNLIRNKRGMYNYEFNLLYVLLHTSSVHSSEIRSLCFMKWPSEMLQNLPFWNTKTHIIFSFFTLCHFIFCLTCQNRPGGYSLGKNIK